MKKLAILGVTVYSFAQLANAATLNVKPYGTTQNGQKVDLYTMSNNNGVSVSFISFGGVITQILTPDAQGKQNNIVLGFDDLKGYEVTDTKEGIHFGGLIGRYANRIGNAKFSLDGKTYNLEKIMARTHYIAAILVLINVFGKLNPSFQKVKLLKLL